MRRAGREFGSERPEVILVAVRWNDEVTGKVREEEMVRMVAEPLKVSAQHLRVYNLLPPSGGRGMTIGLDEYAEVRNTIERIYKFASHSSSLKRIVIAGRSDPMPMVGLLLALLLPKLNVEVRYHFSKPGKPLGRISELRLH